jgi:hypothetical protein
LSFLKTSKKRNENNEAKKFSIPWPARYMNYQTKTSWIVVQKPQAHSNSDMIHACTKVFFIYSDPPSKNVGLICWFSMQKLHSFSNYAFHEFPLGCLLANLQKSRQRRWQRIIIEASCFIVEVVKYSSFISNTTSFILVYERKTISNTNFF